MWSANHAAKNRVTQTRSEHLQMFRTHVSRNLCLEILEHAHFIPQLSEHAILGPKLLLATGCVKLGGKNCVHLPSVGEQTAN